ncbi:MAG TPA: MerR family transcriptional regulator [Gammaproteobacteria bacterium]|nr:MerR family transcriptional regulator [Gammaproteobacteria bacterium]
MNEATTEWLTAAECALRTGLTVRALRVYENYGLIAPGRSADGWRRYGARELLKLNQIGLLKVLGLTLNQIRDLTRGPSSPTLGQLLELQVGTWKRRRAEAERGQAVAEAALRQLQTGRSLSVEELCSLIRSFEMTTSDAAIPAADEHVAADASTLDRYVGYYFRHGALGVSTIARKDTKLVLEPIGQPVLELEQTGEADFALPKFDLVLCFEQIEEGAAKRLVIWQRGTALRLERTCEETARVIKQTIADRIRDRIPMPGGREALRRILDSGRAGNLDCDEMSPEFAQHAQRQLPCWQILGQYFGAIVSIEFLYVSAQGWDIYEVQHENDVHRYRIAMGDDGKVYGFSEASATADKRALV